MPNWCKSGKFKEINIIQSFLYIIKASTNFPILKLLKAYGILPIISNPNLFQTETAPSFVLTTMLNCIALNPKSFALIRQS